MIKSPEAAIERAQRESQQTIPFLQSGDRLTRAEFERRYAAHPHIKKAELIEGVVYVASPVHIQHSEPHLAIATWAGVYRAATPGVRAADNQSIRLDLENEVQPDVCLWLEEESGGQARIPEGTFLEGAPELIIEVAASSAAYDLHDKLRVYRRSGVQEYLVLVAHEQQTLWHRWREGVYQLLQPDENEILQSEVFPGLWLDAAAFWQGDTARMLEILNQGVQSDAHAAFVAQLKGDDKEEKAEE